MLTKTGLLVVSLLMPLVLVSASANAGTTISDRRYWPNDARRVEPDRTVVLRYDLDSASAYGQDVVRPAPAPNASPSAWRYQGGPKSR